jgi:hypothetical protein
VAAASVAAQIRAGLAARLPAPLVDELLAAYEEAKTKFYEGGLRLAEVEGGRFCEAAFRLLQSAGGQTVTPVGRQLNSEQTINVLSNLGATFPDSIRFHIPRSLRVVYDIRNKRDAAHLADGIDPNMQDATLVASVLDWVMAEFVRLYHNVAPDAAQAIVEDLVTRKAPAIQEFGPFLKVLNPKLKVSDRVLVLLYHQGKQGATLPDLSAWVHPDMRRNLARTLSTLEHDRALVHGDGRGFFITQAGLRYVEAKHLLKP